LAGEVIDDADTFDEAVQVELVQVSFDERERRTFRDPGEIGALLGTAVVLGKRVDAENLVTALKEHLSEVRPHESCGARDENAHASPPPPREPRR
jgi:hypothetical protein